MHRQTELNQMPLDQALAEGWRPCPDYRAADPHDRPRQAIGLYAKGGRIAWLLELPDGRHFLEISGRARELLARWHYLAIHDEKRFRAEYAAATDVEREAVLTAALEQMSAQERAAWADRINARLQASREGRSHG
jgi:hypothetical protein